MLLFYNLEKVWQFIYDINCLKNRQEIWYDEERKQQEATGVTVDTGGKVQVSCEPRETALLHWQPPFFFVRLVAAGLLGMALFFFKFRI